MIRYCFIVAVIMIYPHSTNGSYYIGWGNKEDLERQLKKDAPLLGSRLIGKAIAKPFYGNRTDFVCDVLDNDQKQLLCDEMMTEMIFHGTMSGYVESFFDANPRPSVPHLADSSDPYKCVRIPIENFHFSKRMFWCRTRKFYESGPGSVTGEAEGFFLGGRPFCTEDVFAFVLSEKNRDRVVPRAFLFEARFLRNKGPTHEKSYSGSSKNERSSPSVESSTRPRSSHDSSEDSSVNSSQDSSHDSSDSD